MEEALKDNSVLTTENLRVASIQNVFEAPAKFSISFEFIEDILDELLSA